MTEQPATTNRTLVLLWLIQAVGNAVLLMLGWIWLNLEDRATWQVVLSGVLAVVALTGALWLQAGTMVALRARSADIAAAFTSALARLPLLVLWAAVLLALRWALSLALAQVPATSPVLAWTLSALGWVVLLGLLLPVGMGLAAEGAGGLRSALASWRNGRYWLTVAAMVVLGFVIAPLLVVAVGPIGSFPVQMASAILRALLAFVLAVTAWLGLLYGAARASLGTPRSSQFATVATV